MDIKFTVLMFFAIFLAINFHSVSTAPEDDPAADEKEKDKDSADTSTKKTPSGEKDKKEKSEDAEDKNPGQGHGCKRGRGGENGKSQGRGRWSGNKGRGGESGGKSKSLVAPESNVDQPSLGDDYNSIVQSLALLGLRDDDKHRSGGEKDKDSKSKGKNTRGPKGQQE